MTPLREGLLNTSDTPCDLIALAFDAVRAPATSLVARSSSDDKSRSKLSIPSRHDQSVPPSPLVAKGGNSREFVNASAFLDSDAASCEPPGVVSPVAPGMDIHFHSHSPSRSQEGHPDYYAPKAQLPSTGARRSSSVKSSPVLQNEGVFRDVYGNKPTDLVLQPRLSSQFRKYDGDIVIRNGEGRENRSYYSSRGGQCASQQSGDVGLQLLKRDRDVRCLTTARDRAYPPTKQVTKSCNSLSSGLSGSEVAFENEVGLAQKPFNPVRHRESKAKSLVPYSCASNDISSTKDSGPFLSLRRRPDSAVLGNNSVNYLSMGGHRNVRATSPSPFPLSLQPEEREFSTSAGEHLGIRVDDVKPRTKRQFIGKATRDHSAKKARKKNGIFSRPSGAQFDELVSGGRLDKHLWVQERKLQGANVGMILPAPSVRPSGIRKKAKRPRSLRFLR